MGDTLYGEELQIAKQWCANSDRDPNRKQQIDLLLSNLAIATNNFGSHNKNERSRSIWSMGSEQQIRLAVASGKSIVGNETLEKIVRSSIDQGKASARKL